MGQSETWDWKHTIVVFARGDTPLGRFAAWLRRPRVQSARVIEKRGGYSPSGHPRPTTPPPKPTDAARSAMPPPERVEVHIYHTGGLMSRSATSTYSVNGRHAWTIRVCDCGFPLGAVLAAIKLKKCPDCGRPTVPVEDVTTRVTVVEALDV